MQDDDHPFAAHQARLASDAASLLATESLDRYSQSELAERITQLETEIARVKAHRDKAAAHRAAADAFFKPKAG